MILLILIISLVKLLPSEIQGGSTAPKMRLFCFKTKNTAQDSAIREDSGRYLVALTNLGLFICQKNKEVVMPTINEQCSNCLFTYTPLDHISIQFTKISFVIDGAIHIMQDENSNLPSYCGPGLSSAWSDFQEALRRYIESKQDDPTLVMGE